MIKNNLIEYSDLLIENLPITREKKVPFENIKWNENVYKYSTEPNLGGFIRNENYIPDDWYFFCSCRKIQE